MNEIVIKEGKAEISLPSEIKISRKSPVFYNPAMEVNRDFSITFLYPECSNAKVLDMLAGSGIRGIRYFLECENVRECWFIEKNPLAFEYLKKNVEKNNIFGKIFLDDARKLTLEWQDKDIKFKIIDIDPFGSPIHFIYFAGLVIDRKNGILAITATDLGALYSQSITSTIRKYFANNNKLLPFHQEIGIRILIANVARELLKHNLGIKVLGYHFYKHFIRIYLRVSIYHYDETLENLGFISFDKNLEEYKFVKLKEFENNKLLDKKFGILWIGKLTDKEYLDSVLKFLEKFDYMKWFSINKKYLEILYEESCCFEKAPYSWSYPYNFFGKILKAPNLPKITKVIEKLKEVGFEASRTPLYRMNAIRTNASLKLIKSLINELIK